MDTPLPILIPDIEIIQDICELNEIARKIIDEFFPGPVTVIVKKKPKIPDVVTCGLEKVGIRMPDHKIALKILELSNVPLATPSANISGKPSPTRAEHVIEDFKGLIDVIVDGGQTGIGIESTVIDTTKDPPEILRIGAIPVEEIMSVVGELKIVEKMKYPHYKPNARVYVVFGKEDIAKLKIKELTENLRKKGYRVGVVSEDIRSFDADELVELDSDLQLVARKLFDILRTLDKKVDVIVFRGVSGSGLGRAIESRLKTLADEIIYV